MYVSGSNAGPNSICKHWVYMETNDTITGTNRGFAGANICPLPSNQWYNNHLYHSHIRGQPSQR